MISLSLRRHLVLAAVLLVLGAVLVAWPAARSAAWLLTVVSIVTHLGIALLALLGFRLFRLAHQPAGPMGQIDWARRYDLLVGALSFGRERAFREATLDQAAVVLGERVLDVGCGTGTLALAAARRVGSTGSVTGVDAAPAMIARATSKATAAGTPIRFQVAPAQALPFPDHAFDLVLCTMVFHHLPADARHQAVAEIRRVLRPGGRALIVDLAEANSFWTRINPINLVHGRGHQQIASEAAGLMAKSGFDHLDSGRFRSGVLGYALGVRPNTPN